MVVMTFGLKNASATYQRAMNFIFHEFISKLVEIYIDDVVVKSGILQSILPIREKCWNAQENMV